ncbi:uncharacterized protein LOC132120987 [Carassius carassius]|uniref:uncharacterized protein LOC132120987 n=1 Tax=Carassius carassius TaxID=217509 RepID=UPI00286840CF|nr:uncharacterized protein LOC132120987 [Carassius carassius]
MSLSKSTASPGNSLSRACPAACGALIAAKDLHPFCVVCLGLKHAQEALENMENCSHCLKLPKKLLRRSLKVAVALCAKLSFSDSDGGHGDDDALPGDSQGYSSLVWADQPNPAFSEEDIFAGNLMLTDEPAGSGDKDDAALLGVSEDEEAILPSGVPQASGHAALPQSILLEVCERAAARLNIEWPAPQSATDQERDIYDRKVLEPPPGPRKQLFPAAYKSSALAVRALNFSSLLSAYQAEILDELGQQLEKGTPSLPLWKGILTVNDLVLRNAWQAVQACGRSMALSVVGEHVLWLNLSGLPDSEKRRIALMQQRCDDNKKKEDEAFKLCLPRKAAPRQTPPARLPNTPAMGQHFHQGKERPRNKPPPRQKNPLPAKHWGKSTPAVAAAGRPSNPTPIDSKRKRPA